MNVCLLLAHQLGLSLLVVGPGGDIQKYFPFLLWSRTGIHRYVCTTIMEPGRDIQKSSDLSVLIEGAGIFRYQPCVKLSRNQCFHFIGKKAITFPVQKWNQSAKVKQR